MTKEEIGISIDPNYPFVYGPTTEPTKLYFKDGSFKVGFFQFMAVSSELEKQNKYTFIEFRNAISYRDSGDEKYVTTINGNDLIRVEYPAKDDVSFQSEENKVEDSDETKVPIKVPFDPNLIRIRRDPFTLGELIDKIQHNEVNFFTLFQRKDNLWDNVKQSRLIESVLLRLPLPAFYFDEIETINETTQERISSWQVIDGLQRCSVLRNFAVNKIMSLEDLEFLKQFDGKTYDNLPRDLQRRITQSPITVYVVEKGTPDEVKFNIFKRINTGGLVLTPQEIRHALNQGLPAKFVEELSEVPEFREATCYVISADRMEDRDFVTRFVSFYIKGPADYEPDLDSFMTKGMASIKDTTPEFRAEMKNNFIKAMKTAITIFGNDAFRKRQNYSDRRKPINKALFEALSVGFSKLSLADTNKLIVKSHLFKDKFIELNKDSKFIYSLSSGTGQKESVKTRFEEISRIINETINS